jgi:hypothetical protein
MTQQEQEVCSKCGSTHLQHSVRLSIEFSQQEYQAIELMAQRRNESVGDLLFHLLWLESNKVPAARKLLMHHHEEHV